MPAQFKVNKSEAEAFAKVWTYQGVSIPLSESAIQFSTDFANIVLRNFIDVCQQQVQERKKQIIAEGI